MIGTQRLGFGMQKNRLRREGRAYCPRLDALEVRRVLNAACPTISGYVYHDLNNNGLYDASEISPSNAIANSRIELYRGATLVASTVTDANGYYAFQTDATVSTSVQTLRYEASVPLTPTTVRQPLALPQFDPSLGTLVGVRIENGGRIQTRIRLENLGNGRQIEAYVHGTLTLSEIPGAPDAVAVLPQVGVAYNAGAFDDTIDFNGTSGIDSGLIWSDFASTSVSVPAASWASYIGSGTITPLEVAVATSTGTGPGNLVSLIQTSAEITASVVYEYIPRDCLTPGDYVIRQALQPAGYLDGQETRGNVTPLPNSAGGPDAIPITLNGADLPNNNFGELVGAALGDFVWKDLDRDGAQDAGEPGLPGVTITLSGTDDLGSVTRTAVTGADGKYLFGNLRPGSYRVTFGNASGYTRTVANATGDALDSDANVLTGQTGLYTLNSGQINRTVDAGYVTVSKPGCDKDKDKDKDKDRDRDCDRDRDRDCDRNDDRDRDCDRNDDRDHKDDRNHKDDRDCDRNDDRKGDKKDDDNRKGDQGKKRC